jgi:hypothetical protein
VHPERETAKCGQFLEQSFCREFPQFPLAIGQSHPWGAPQTSFPSIPAFSAISATRFGLFDGAGLLALPAPRGGHIKFPAFPPFPPVVFAGSPPQAERQLGPWNRRGE